MVLMTFCETNVTILEPVMKAFVMLFRGLSQNIKKLAYRNFFVELMGGERCLNSSSKSEYYPFFVKELFLVNLTFLLTYL